MSTHVGINCSFFVFTLHMILFAHCQRIIEQPVLPFSLQRIVIRSNIKKIQSFVINIYAFFVFSKTHKWENLIHFFSFHLIAFTLKNGEHRVFNAHHK